MNRYDFRVAALFALTAVLGGHGALSGETPAGGGNPVHQGETATDPFAELMQSYPSEVLKTGPTCSIVRIQLPPGMTAEDIPGLSAVK